MKEFKEKSPRVLSGSSQGYFKVVVPVLASQEEGHGRKRGKRNQDANTGDP